MEAQLRDVMVESLTVDTVPIIQSSRLEDYSPELWALTGGKGATVLGMLRYVIGDEKFFKTLKAYTQQYAWKSANTDDFKKVAETASRPGSGLLLHPVDRIQPAPEFKLEYTILRTTKGFRVMGKIAQDLDTFRMPVDLKIETEGNPEEKRVEVVGTSSEFSVDTFGKPKSVVIDPNNRVLRYSPAGARGGGHPPRRAVRGIERVRRSHQAVPEGARDQPHQLAGPLPDRRSALPAEQLPAGRQ